MKAALFTEVQKPLVIGDLEKPSPSDGQVLIKVRACGVCRTDLHIVDGDLETPNFPRVLGHQIVGEVAGTTVSNFQVGQRVGIPWLGWTCGCCGYCDDEKENLCDSAQFTGYHIDGGFAEFCVADARYCFPLESTLTDLQVAPLLCGGLIGYRAYRMTGNAKIFGFYGFGSAAHILLQVALYENRDVYAITRPGDTESQIFARELGAVWSGDSDESISQPLDAAIIFAPAGDLIPIALSNVRKGGVVVCAGIHMSDIPTFPYEKLWGERTVRSVANLTREDGDSFLKLAAEAKITTSVKSYDLAQVNEALDDLRAGRIEGSAVIEIQ